MALPAGNTQWLGATPTRNGTNFAFYAGKEATNVELCLFDAEGKETRHELTAREEVKRDDGSIAGYIWHGFAEGVKPGALYGFRVDGPLDVDNGLYFNRKKLLLDPMAKAVTGHIDQWEERNWAQNPEDNADIMPKARVVDWQALQKKAAPPGALYSIADTITREIHVKGATKRFKKIPENIRGKFKALSHPLMFAWARRQGITSLELMPIEAFGTDKGLADKGLTNYWGYMTTSFTAPHDAYGTPREFVDMVRTLKENEIEVIMDVVPNHTIENGPDGPVVNLRGMDSSLYLSDDYTGTGNSRDFGHPMNRRMFLEELKYWRSLGVSGFRIDLTPVLGRVEMREHRRAFFDSRSTMMDMLREEPELQDIKLSGEPWDVSKHNDGYQLGHIALPDPQPHQNNISEWSDEYREKIAMVTLNHESHPTRADIAWLLADHFPLNHIHMIGSHDGGTLLDRLSYKKKNNWENKEQNNDGHDMHPHGHCYWGNDDDRYRVQRFAIAMLGLTQGPVLLTEGDERGQTLNGNTNTYCQDKESSYTPWDEEVSAEGQALSDFTEQVFALRHKHTSLRRGTPFQQIIDKKTRLTVNHNRLKEVTWLSENGRELSPGEMNNEGGLMMLTSGDPGNSPPGENHFTRKVQRKYQDVPMLVLVNASKENMEFTLPYTPGIKWQPTLYSLKPEEKDGKLLGSSDTVTIGWKSVMVFEGQRERSKAPPIFETIYQRVRNKTEELSI